jgi:hypothetical protein
MPSDQHNPASTGNLPVQLRRLSKLLASTVERLETVESLQAVTVDEQANLSEQLEKLATRLGLAVNQRCTCMTRVQPLADDPFRNGTEYEEYRPS